MADTLHPAATHHLPTFITSPGGTDVLMVVMSVILVVAVFGFGILFLRLHTMPERIAHRGHKLQFEIVAVLGLIALFTHMHIFWIAGLLLAMIDLPDFGTPLNRIAGSAEKIAGMKPGEGAVAIPTETFPTTKETDQTTEMAPETGASATQRAGLGTSSAKPQVVASGQKELSHA